MSKFIDTLLGFALPLGILFGGLWLLQQPWEELSHPRIAKAVKEISQPTDILVLGNSVTATLDVHSLSSETQLRVRIAAMEGSLPAHWTALLAQARIRYRTRPQIVMIYVAENNLYRTKLTDERDIAMLEQLSPHIVDGLSEKALGQASSHPILKNRISLRERILSSLSHYPVKLVWPGAYGFIDHSVEEVFGSTKPNETARKSATPGQSTRHQEAKEATIEAFSDSILPLLQREVNQMGARLVIVLPARSQPLSSLCQTPEHSVDIGHILDSGTTILDLRGLAMNKTQFSSLHHLNRAGAQYVSKWLGKGILEEKSGMWMAGCSP